MSEIRSMLVETVEKILKSKCTKELVLSAEKGSMAKQLWNQLESSGMTLVGIEERFGGVGGDLGDAYSLLKIAGKYSAPIPLAETFLANWLLSSSHLSIPQEAATIGPARKTDTLSFLPARDGWVISGKMKYIPWARDVKTMAVFGKTDKMEEIVASISLDECQIVKGESLAGEPRDEVILNNVFVSSERVSMNISINENDIWHYCTLTRIALMAGALEQIADLTIKYVNERLQFGQPIGKFQAVKQQLAIMAGEVVASSMTAESMIATIDQGYIDIEVGMAKIQLCEASTIVSKIAHQVIGAMGFTNEHALHLSTRRVWSWQDEYGTASKLAHIVGDHVLHIGSENVWPMICSSRSLQTTNQ